MRTAFLLLVFTATALQGWAQNAENRQISLEMKNEPLGSALKQFSNVSGYKVNFPSEEAKNDWGEERLITLGNWSIQPCITSIG